MRSSPTLSYLHLAGARSRTVCSVVAHPSRQGSAPVEDRPYAPTLLRLLAMRGLRRLIGVRVLSSFGDGAFQGALVSAVLFNPERQSSAAAIAGGFAVLLLPYSIIGPFAGALLDRWSRRGVIITATVLRAVLVAVVAVELALGAASWLLLVSALAVTGAARFVGSGLSAALPHTVHRDNLVEGNALTTTSGAIATAAGGGYAIVMRDVIGDTDLPVAAVTASVVVFYLLAVLLASGFARNALGPDETDEPAQPLRAVLAGLTSGLSHAIHRPTVGMAISVVVLVRFCFGMATLLILLLYQHHFKHQVGPLLPGLNGLAEVLAAISLGLLAGAVLTPLIVRWLGRTATLVSLMGLAAVTVLTCGPPFQMVTTVVAAPVLAFVYQSAKVCVDAIVQHDSDDAFVGRVFALYDTANNIAYVGAFAIGALFVPFDGRSVPLLLAMAAVYLVTGIGYALGLRSVRARHSSASSA
jgi:MFS family permease